MKLPEPMKQLSDDYIRGWNECLQAVRDLNNTEDADGWIPWEAKKGAVCPLPKGTRFKCKYLSGEEGECVWVAPEAVWSPFGEGTITAYKVVG